MALNDVLNEIVEGARKAGIKEAASEKSNENTKKEKKERAMTKEEIEAYRARKMREEEARYLKSDKKGKPGRKKKDNGKKKEDVPAERPARKRSVRKPKMLQPLQPLYLLKIPGLPNGDCIAICLAHGADPS